MKLNTLIVRTVPLSSLVVDESNPRLHDERDLSETAASLAEHGQVDPLVVQAGTMRVVAGNGRLEAMRRLGWVEAQVVEIECDDAAFRKISVRLNRTGELAGWDANAIMALAEEWPELAAGLWSDDELAGLLASAPALERADLDAVAAAPAAEERVELGTTRDGTPTHNSTEDYLASNTKKFEFYCEQSQYEDVVRWLGVAKKGLGVETNSEAVLALLADYEARCG